MSKSRRWLTYYFALPQDNIRFLRDSGFKGDFLISFAHFTESKQQQRAIDLTSSIAKGGNRVMLDSGAFTNLNKPGTVRLEQYAEFLKSESKRFSEYVTLDDIRSREKTVRNYIWLCERGYKPLFVDHLAMGEDQRLSPIWRKVKKLCLSGWGTDPSTHHQNKNPKPEEKGDGSNAAAEKPSGGVPKVKDLPARLQRKIDQARKDKTRVHLLAVGSLRKFLPHLDVIESVDSAVVFRCVGYGQILHATTADVGGTKVPILERCAHPEARTDHHRDTTPEVKRKFAEFCRGRKFSTKNNAYRAFCFHEISKYVDAINAMSPQQLMAAQAAHAKQKTTTKSFFAPLGFDEGSWDWLDDPLAPPVADVVKLDTAGDSQLVDVNGRVLRVTVEPVEPEVDAIDKRAEELMDAPGLTIDLLPVEKKETDESAGKQIVFGVVLEPDSTDAQGDTIKADEIERAAHLWLARFQDRGVQHNKIANSKMELYESYIAPADLTINGQKVKKGTWLLMLHVLDADLWKQVKEGSFTGFSMGGFARRVKV